MNLILTRTENTQDGVFGRLAIGNEGDAPTHVGNLVLHTMEDDWKNNQPNESCIPAGTYVLRRRWSPKHKLELFGIEGVPGRHDIEIHIANTEEDVLGCIGIGLRRGVLRVRDEDDPAHLFKDKRAVLESGSAFRRFMDAMSGIDECPITVAWGPGLPGTAAA